MLNSMIRKASRSSAPVASSVASSNVRLLHSELSRTSWLIAVVGSVFNAALVSGKTEPLSQVVNFLPGQLASTGPLPEQSDQNVQALALSLDQFHGQVDMARRMTASRLSMIAGKNFDSRDVNVTEIVHVLSETWRKLALAAQLQLYQVQSFVVRRADEGAIHVSQDIIVQLKQVARGDSPCVDGSGVVQFGGLVDRRGAPRVVVSMSVVIKSRGMEQACTVTNVSATGVGLDNVFGVSAGEDIWIGIADGVDLPGCVVWADQGHAGVQLQSELSAAEWLDRQSTAIPTMS